MIEMTIDEIYSWLYAASNWPRPIKQDPLTEKGAEKMETQQEPQQTDDLYGLAPKEETAIQALISNRTLKQAAAAAGISDTTLWRWLRKPHFRNAYLDARRSIVPQSIARFQQLSSDAPGVLHSIMLDESQNGAIRIAAAKMIVGSALKGVELEDHGERLEEIGAALRNR